MKVSRIALLAALGMFAMALPASAAPAVSGSTDIRSNQPALIQLAQSGREASEPRGGHFKGKKAKKSKAKKAKKKKGKK